MFSHLSALFFSFNLMFSDNSIGRTSYAYKLHAVSSDQDHFSIQLF